MTRKVLFLCPHSAAKSVIAATWFDALAQQQNLAVSAFNGGTDPDDEVWPSVVSLLADHNLTVTIDKPRYVTQDDLDNAIRVVSLGCDVSSMNVEASRYEAWDDVPMASEDLEACHDVIKAHVETLVTQLQNAG